MRLRSWRTGSKLVKRSHAIVTRELTGNTGKKLTSKLLDLTAREGNESVTLQEVKHTLTQQICHDAYMVPEIKAVPQVDALVAVGFII
jgi:hypothetical protein